MTVRQATFGFAAQDLPPASRASDPETSKAAERTMNRMRRRHSQIGLILERLRQSPATNAQLARISLKYTGRISDLRSLGFQIACERQAADGTTLYRLTHDAGDVREANR